MTKIMLVEDDKSLREIYGVRLLAEGYDIVSAGDGEEALAMAIKERPQLIISDVMMPKISGFDLLDILRSTTETRDIKVIMMTALSSESQRQRGEQLGADRYLVKSQVGIEDVVRVVHEVLNDPKPAAPPTEPAQSPAAASAPAAPAVSAPASTPPVPPSGAGSRPLPIPEGVTPPTIPTAAPPAAPPAPPAPAPASAPAAPPAPPTPAETPSQAAPSAASVVPPQPQTQPSDTNPLPPPAGAALNAQPLQHRSRTIQPINDPDAKSVNLDELLSRELAKEAGIDESNAPVVASTAETQAEVASQMEEFAQTPPEPTAVENIPTVTIDSAGVVATPQDRAAAAQGSLPQPSPQPTAAPASPDTPA